MAKHRKTRQEKKIADQRHILYHLETNSAQVSTPTEKKTAYKLDLTPVSQKETVTAFAYVTRDLRKTAFITAAIVGTQAILFFLINRV